MAGKAIMLNGNYQPMDYKDIKLPGQVIADMYKSVLVSSAPVAAGEEISDMTTPGNLPAPIQFLGNNAKGILVVVTGIKKISEASAEIQFLLKILKACNLALDDIAIVDQKKMPGDWNGPIRSLAASKLLLFSSELSGSEIPEDLYFQIREQNEAQLVYAPEISMLIKEDATATRLKKRLWQVLKAFFNV